MRHFHRLRLPLSLSRSLVASVALCVGAAAILVVEVSQATPVYLRLDSRFPSGHYPRRVLESRMRGVQFQQWLRVETKDRAYGWLPEDHLVTPLKLAAQAELTEDSPIRTSANMDALGGDFVKKKTHVLILEIAGSWVRAQPLPVSENEDGWFPTSVLKADLASPAPKAFLPQTTSLYVLPGPHARLQALVHGPKFVQVIREQNGWLEIRDGTNGNGFIHRKDAVLLSDLGLTGARPLFQLAPLRSAPLPYADLVRSMGPETNLRVIAQRTLRWSQSQLKDLGTIWWPTTDEADD